MDRSCSNHTEGEDGELFSDLLKVYKSVYKTKDKISSHNTEGENGELENRSFGFGSFFLKGNKKAVFIKPRGGAKNVLLWNLKMEPISCPGKLLSGEQHRPIVQ